MATYTSKLNLKKPLGTEHVSRQDMNDNYDKIDAGVVTNVDGEISNSLLIGVRASGSSVGARSIAIGGNVEASGSNSFACGNGAKASGSASHAEQSAIATGYHSHAENASTASGEGSHAENQSDAVGKYSHSENYSYAKGNYSHAEGYGTYAKGKGQHVGGKFNVYDPTGDYDEYGTYAEIIGNGTAAGSANRSNARALDWDGNEYLKGNLYVGCNADSTGGTKISDAFTGATSSVAGSVGLVPAPSAGDQDKFLAGDGTWKVPSGGSDMTGATASTAGTHGLVPAPAAGDQNKVLKGDGTWGEMDVSGKADKVASATSGNFAGLDSNGNLTDSEVGPEDLLQLDSELEDGTKAAPADVVGQLALMKTDHIYNETEPSAICSVSDGAALPIKTLTVDIDPVQDLHGYDSPWPGGGGKNKLNVDALSNTADITISDGNIIVKGTSRNSGKKLKDIADLTVGETYILTATSTGSNNFFYLYGINESWYFSNQRTITQQDLDSTIFFYGDSDASVSVTISNMMIRLSSVSDATFAPYKNVCPISGWNSANVTRTGKNLVDIELTSGLAQTTETFVQKLSGSIAFSVHSNNAVVDASVMAGNYNWIASATFEDGSKLNIYLPDYTGQYGAGLKMPGVYTVSADNPIVSITYRGYGITSGSYDLCVAIGDDATFAPYSGSTAEYEFPQEAKPVYGAKMRIWQDGSGELVVDRETVAFPNNHTFNLETNQNRRRFEFNTSDYGLLKGELTSISSHFKLGRPENAPFGYFYLAKATSTTYFTFYDGDSKFASASELETWLQDQATNGTPVQVTFDLATPVTYQLTNQQVLSLLKGNNVCFADCGSVSIEYPADTKLYIDGKVAELQALILENISNS